MVHRMMVGMMVGMTLRMVLRIMVPNSNDVHSHTYSTERGCGPLYCACTLLMYIEVLRRSSGWSSRDDPQDDPQDHGPRVRPPGGLRMASTRS